MWKKLSMIMLALTVAFSFSIVSITSVADAAKGRSFKAPASSQNSNTPPAQSNNLKQTEPTNASKATNTTSKPNTVAKPGFFNGGLMKGLLIGGLAGMLLGGLLGDLGILGSILGLLINLLAIGLVIALVVKIVHYFRNKPRYD
ncbi:hypothetical protein SPSYN_01265 [Sporotomaculum syntrophicum]|uniref:Preprotein translocase subunit Tim44 n=1 Tax=Sporotomaculum syntrophicum TaxID=182264 RepID=A0A9D2WPT0_9FIRM|nr:hypothetical protein [Sporotomaculum syntrophicum]KAF1085129.1 hypothetical protein SPSYN_01265 [Sporotomaculum syntrophicum]